MRSLFILLVAFAVANCDRQKRGTGNWGSSLANARINSQEMRLSQLSQQLDDLEAQVAQGNDDIPASMQTLSIRLNKIEGNDCGDRQYSCGRHSGQCVYQMLVCDNVKDCDNGNDESEETCNNPVPAGRSWKGVANWESCLVRSNNKMNLLVTGNKRISHFPSQLWVDAVIVESYSVAGQTSESTWRMSGFYNYASKTIKLSPPDGSEMGIGMVCTDAGNKAAQCNFVRVTDGFVCGTVTLTRSD